MNKRLNVMVVEDDPSIRHVVVDLLNMLGYAVAVAGTAEEGLALFRAGEYAAVLVDVDLPGASGIEFAKDIHGRDAHVAILFTTGNAYLISSALPFSFRVVAKPYNLTELGIVLRQALKAKRVQAEVTRLAETRNTGGAVAVG